MSRLFGAYVLVDWSSASKPATGTDSIWIGVMKRNVRLQLAYEAHNPPTRREAEALLERILGDLGRRGDRALLGFDFPLGFPRGTAEALKLPGASGGAPWAAQLRFVSGEVKDKPDNSNNRFQVGAKMNRLMTGEAFPFWGCPARDAQTMLAVKRPREHRDGDLPEFRHTEEALAAPASIWKLYYQGSVGGQALTGMPVVQRLRLARGEAARVWPFETGWTALTPAALEGVDVVIAEIDPSIVTAKPDGAENKDAAQVRALAEHLADLDQKGKLAALFGPAKGREGFSEAVAQEEGWILGV